MSVYTESICVLGDAFVEEDNSLHKYIIKGALAYGPIVHGKDVPESCNELVAYNKEYISSILLGLPMIEAIKGKNGTAFWNLL